MAQGALNADQVRVAGTGHLYVGATALTAPTTLADLDSAWTELGYTFEDGVTLEIERDVASVMSWQSKRPVRKFNASAMERITTELQQWNEHNLVLAFGGGTVTEPSPGLYRYDFPDPEEFDERTLVLDWEDDGYNYRLVIPKGSVTDTTEVQLTRTAEARLPITFEVVDEAPYILTDDPNFEAGEGS